MTYIIQTKKDIEQASSDLEVAVKNNGFGVLHIHDLKATLNSKGIAFEQDCRVFEVCNPHKAKEVLDYDMTLNMALPCRISIWQQGNTINIGMISPQATLALLSQSQELSKMAAEVEATLEIIIDQAAS